MLPLLRVRVLAIALAALSVAGCRTAVNFADPDGPRFAGSLPVPAPRGDWPDTLLVVSFNVEEAAEVERALEVLVRDPFLAAADVLLLQEMDAAGTARMAEALGMAWVYYPAARRNGTGREFGNAVLARWPIVDDTKILLPNVGTFGRMRRTATAATLDVGGVPVRVYSLHLATPLELGILDRREQLRAVLDDASTHPRVILGGDFNSGGLAGMAEDRGFTWVTEDGPRTVVFGRFDHILFRGLAPAGEEPSGTVLDNGDASDHKPVWARGVMR